jgi:hypothetical protein
MQAIGRPFDERTLLRLALASETKRHPSRRNERNQGGKQQRPDLLRYVFQFGKLMTTAR